mgnify:CR=1 FL=1|tara:strand:- start:379 stop:654 length:276 start_codon:yes stop_codon:yes gene_type:complete
MGVNEFYDYLPKHFWNKLDGFYELENMREKTKWERVRWQTTLLLNIQIGKGKKLKPTDLIEFEWDKKQKKIDYKKLKEKAEYIKKLSEHKK